FVLYRALMILGRLNELRERVPSVFREVEELGDRYSSINLRSSPMALLGLAADDPERVRADMEEVDRTLARGGFHIQHFSCLVGRAQLEMYRREPAQALARVRATWPALRQSLLLRV